MRIVMTVVLLTVVLGTGVIAQDNADENAIREAVQAIPAALNARDWAAAAAQFVEQGDLILPGSPRVQGREAIQSLWEKNWPDVPERRITVTIRSVRRITSDVAIVDATAEFSAGEPAHDRATYVVVRRDGVWKVSALRVMRAQRLMTPQDLDKLDNQAPDSIVAYGQDKIQYGELRVPRGPGPHPVVILIHGGCFKAAYATARYLGPIGDALKAEGIASWNIEYRRLGQAGGGWPGTYIDVGLAVDHLRTLASRYKLDLSRIVIVGHSAGGHLAMWAASRAKVPTSSPIYAANPLAVRGVVDLAGPVDMTANISGYEALCGDTVITSLLGGTPTTVPMRYENVSAAKLLPLGLPQVIIVGEHENFVPQQFGEAYVRAAVRAGDSVRLVVIPQVGHFELASPLTSSWPRVREAIRSLLDGKLPPDSSRPSH